MIQAKLPVLTLEWLHERTREERDEDDTVHLIWLRYSQEGHPKANMPIDGKWRPVNVRRAVWSMAHNGRAPRVDRMVKNRCGVFNCVAPECMIEAPWGDRSRGNKLAPHMLQRMAEGKRANSKVPHEDVPDIIASADWLPSGVLMEVYGVSRETINAIRRLELHRDYQNPWLRLAA